MKRLRLGLLAIPFIALAGCGMTTPTPSVNVDALACEEKLSTTTNELDACLQAAIVNTGTINTGTINTGTKIPSTGTDTDIVNDTISSDTEDTLRTHTMYPPQPKYAPGNYPDNTTQLNNYAHANMVNVQVPPSYTKMTVELKQPVASKGRNLILYIRGNGRHCGGRVLGSITPGEQTFIFDLTNMDIQGSSCDGDRRTKLGTIDTIKAGGFISEYNGNQINVIYFN